MSLAAAMERLERLRRFNELYAGLIVAPTVPGDDADLRGFGMPSLKAKAVELGIKKDGVG